MKPDKLNSILKNLRKGEVKKNDKWEPVNLRVVKRIKKQLVRAHYVLKDKEEAKQHRRILEKLIGAQGVQDYLDSDELKTRRVS